MSLLNPPSALEARKQNRAGILAVLSLADLSLLAGLFLAYSIRDARGKIVIAALGIARVCVLGAMALSVQRGELKAAAGLAVAATGLWAVSVAVAVVGSAAHVPAWVVTLACNLGPVSGIVAPAQWTFVWRKHRFSVLRAMALVVFTVAKLAGVSVVWAYHLLYPNYAKAFACYGTEATVHDYTLGYCPQYTDEPYWSTSSVVCRDDALDGTVAHLNCNAPYHALPHAWHNWHPWVTMLAYVLLGVWAVQWIPATYHGRLLTADAVHNSQHALTQAPSLVG